VARVIQKVGYSEFDAGVVGRELPVGFGVMGIAIIGRDQFVEAGLEDRNFAAQQAFDLARVGVDADRRDGIAEGQECFWIPASGSRLELS